MALRQIMLNRELDALQREREQLAADAEKIRADRATWSEREANATQAFEEITDETPAEERAAFEAEATEIDNQDKELTEREDSNAQRATEVEVKIKDLESELAGINARAKAGREKPAEKTINQTERGNAYMEIREMVKLDHVKTFLAETRQVIRSGGVNGASLTVPTEMLPLVSKATERYSKLLKHVNHQTISGDGKQNLLGSIPEAVWTDMVGKINPVDLAFSQIQTAGNKLGAYVAVPNSYIEDSDEDLAGIIIDYLGQANGYALDKGILYGTGVNSPVGIETRLVASSTPAWWQTNMPTFTDLHTSNCGTLSGASVTGAALYKELVLMLGKAKAVYNAAKGDKFWAMNSGTWLKLQGELISINASGAVATGANLIMPVIGGAVEILDFVPDGEIIGGVGSQYLLAERRGIEVKAADQALFFDDATAFRATSRWDGMPIAGEGFAKFVLATSDTTAPELAEDTANGDAVTLTALSGTNLTLSPAFASGTYNYTASVASSVASTTLTVTPMSGATVAAITLNGGTTGVSNKTVTLSSGQNVIAIKVKYGNTVNTYTITVTKAS